jgi:dipeptidyl aminopeptidase/acylaminoacyl peptidase
LPSDPIALLRDAPSEGILSVDQFRDALTIESPDDPLPKYKKQKLRTSLALLYLRTGEIVSVPDVGAGGYPMDWSTDGARLLVARVDPADGTLALWTWNRLSGAWFSVSRNRTGLGAAMADGPIRLVWHGPVTLAGGKKAGGIWINTDEDGDTLLPDTVGCWTPDLSADGRTVVYARKAEHSTSDSTIFLRTLGESEAHPITRGSHPRFSRDGKWIVFQREMSSGNSDIWIMRADGGAKRQLTRTDDVEEYPALSPDGRYVVYASTRGDSKSSQLYLARVSDGVEQEVTHAGQNSRPIW